jgi:hypothetical protein
MSDNKSVLSFYPPKLRALRKEFDVLHDRMEVLASNILRLREQGHYEEVALLETEFLERFERSKVVLKAFDAESDAWFARMAPAPQPVVAAKAEPGVKLSPKTRDLMQSAARGECDIVGVVAKGEVKWIRFERGGSVVGWTTLGNVQSMIHETARDAKNVHFAVV